MKFIVSDCPDLVPLVELRLETSSQFKDVNSIMEKHSFQHGYKLTFVVIRAQLEDEPNCLIHAFIKQYDHTLTTEQVRKSILREISIKQGGQWSVKEDYKDVVNVRLRYERLCKNQKVVETEASFLQSFAKGEAYGREESLEALKKIYKVYIHVLDQDNNVIPMRSVNCNEITQYIIFFRKGSVTSICSAYFDIVLGVDVPHFEL